jgi:hypothetical protein
MANTVLSGTSGALYYKPAGTKSQFLPAAVTTGTGTITLATFLNFQAGDPVKFVVVDANNGSTSGSSLPTGITAGTTYYVKTYNSSTGAATFSSTAGGSLLTITATGSAVGSNSFQVAYADFVSVGQVRDWKFSVSRSELDVTTIGAAPGQFAPFKSYISGFADGSGDCTVFVTDDDYAMSNRIVQDVLQRQQLGAAFKLYTNQVLSSGTVNDVASRWISMDAVLTSADLAIDPDSAQTISIKFRPTGNVTFDLYTSA